MCQHQSRYGIARHDQDVSLEPRLAFDWVQSPAGREMSLIEIVAEISLSPIFDSFNTLAGRVRACAVVTVLCWLGNSWFLHAWRKEKQPRQRVATLPSRSLTAIRILCRFTIFPLFPLFAFQALVVRPRSNRGMEKVCKVLNNYRG